MISVPFSNVPSEQARILSQIERIVVLLNVATVSLETKVILHDYKVYQAQVVADRARAIRSKNLVVKLLKAHEAQDRLAYKKRKATSDGNVASKSEISWKTVMKNE